MASLSFSTTNIQGCLHPLKRFSLFSFLKKSVKSHICFLQDTHTDISCEALWHLIWRGKAVFSHSLSAKVGGVAILFSPTCQVEILENESFMQGRALYCKVKIKSRILHLINIYAPCNDTERRKFFETVQLFLEQKIGDYLHEEICLGGDFNCTLEAQLDRSCGIEYHGSSCKTLSELVNFCKLRDIHRDFLGKKKSFTWKNTQGSASRIDRFYFSSFLSASTINVNVIACPLSDHDSVFCRVCFKDKHTKASYWKMNCNLLQDSEFFKIISNFWCEWQKEKYLYKDLHQWWDLGKIKIKQLSQQYSSFKKNQFQYEKSELQRQLKNIEQHINCKSNNNNKELYNTLSSKLNNIINYEIKGAALRSRMKHLQESDTSSKYFFNLEKQKGRARTISHFRNDDGRILDSLSDMSCFARNYYADLYKMISVSKEKQENILSHINKIDASNARCLEDTISIEELELSVRAQNNDKAPGIDGIPAEFYKTFWPLIKYDFLDMINYSISCKCLPLSCRRAIITLLPKAGDLGEIKNWRPVSLLCNDYKIFTKTIVNRLKIHLPDLVHLDQSYCISGRNIHHNIHLIRDIIYQCNYLRKPLAVISLDQEKAFDRVDHSYLYNTLEKIGFGPYFIGLIKTAYSGLQSLIKLNGSLTAPFAVSRSLRQGCALSGFLYSLCIEPLLACIRNCTHIDGIKIENTDMVKLSAYADDITIFITSNSSFEYLGNIIKLYEQASGAKINFTKSQGLWCGEWISRNDNPLNLCWRNDFLKVLGVHLGNIDCTQLNFSSIPEKIRTVLLNWKPVVKTLSYRGRSLIINQLCASKLWHVLNCCAPPHGLVDSIQKLFSDFFWQGKHYTKVNLLYLPKENGGQGLMSIKARIYDFRLQFLMKMLYRSESHPCFWLARSFISTIAGLNYIHQFFYCEYESKRSDLNHLSIFYKHFLQLVESYPIIDIYDENLSFDNICQEPLLFNRHIGININESLKQMLCTAGITRISDIVNWNAKRIMTVDELQAKLHIHSSRQCTQVLKKILDAIPGHWLQTLSQGISSGVSCPRQVQDPTELFIVSCKYNYRISLLAEEKRAFYLFFVGETFDDVENVGLKWCHTLSLNIKPNISYIYSGVNYKKDCDLQWRFIHMALLPMKTLHTIGYTLTEKCLFCRSEETLPHIFINCPRNELLFRYLTKHIGHLYTPHTSFSLALEWWLFGAPINKHNKQLRVVINWMIITAKTAIWISRGNMLAKKGPTDVLAVYKTRIMSRLLLEYSFHKMMNTVEQFHEKWYHGTFFNIVDGMIILRDI